MRGEEHNTAVEDLLRLEEVIQKCIPEHLQQSVRSEVELTYYWIKLDAPKSARHFLSWVIWFLQVSGESGVNNLFINIRNGDRILSGGAVVNNKSSELMEQASSFY